MAVISLTGYEPRPRYDDAAWTSARIESTVDLENWVSVETFVFEDPDDDPSEPKTRNFTTVITDPEIIYLRVVFIDDDENSDLTNPVPTERPATLAAITDVQYRLGRELNDTEETQVVALLGMATVNIYNAVDKAVGWEPPLDVRRLFTVMCVELATRAMSNPQALGQLSESLGAYSKTVTFPREIPGSGIMLTNAEELMLRRAVYGSNAGMGTSQDFAANGSFLQPMVWIH